MKNSSDVQICGAHGTTSLIAPIILKNGFQPSSFGYLHAGVYFFQCDPLGIQQAIRWGAKRALEANDGSVAEVVSAKIIINASNVLYLMQPKERWDFIKKTYCSLREKHKDDLIFIKNMKIFLHRVCKDALLSQGCDYNDSVIISSFPALDGEKVAKGVCCIVVKPRVMSSISICESRCF